MEHLHTGFNYRRYDNRAELPAAYAPLMGAAEKASSNAYAPFSGFRVGAAALVETPDGTTKLFSASNQESEVLPAGMCAERSLLAYLMSNIGQGRIRAVAVYSPDGEKAVSPCGICRQSLLDAEKRMGNPIKLLLGSPKEVLEIDDARSLLPIVFELNH